MNIIKYVQGKKAQAKGILNKLLLGVLAVFATVAIAPSLFEALNDSTLITYAPAWVLTILGIVVGFGIIFVVYKALID